MTSTGTFLEVRLKTSIILCYVYRWFGEVCSTTLLNTTGGPASEIWVFCMVDTSQSPALGSMQIVPDRTAATLLPILQQHVATGCVVHSDQWASYNQVGNLPNVSAHGTVNHSMKFVSLSGVHMQNVESYWNQTKMKLKRMRGCAAKEVPSYLDEFMWRERFGKTPREVLNGIMRDIAQQCPV